MKLKETQKRLKASQKERDEAIASLATKIKNACEQKTEGEVLVQGLQQQLADKPLYLPGAAVWLQAQRSCSEYLYKLPVVLANHLICAKDKLSTNVAVDDFLRHVERDIERW